VQELAGAPVSFWTLERIARALGGGPADGRPVTGITTDTRDHHAGECFVALKGERFDAHDFLMPRWRPGRRRWWWRTRGAPPGWACRCSRCRTRWWRWGSSRATVATRGRVPVIAVGGSNGKTSTKELLRAALGSRFAVHATRGNLNNRIGVPLTLLALDDAADVAVIEAGTNAPGEIAILRDIIRPDVAVVTTVQEEHLEGLGDLAGVLAEELSLCDEVPLAVVPAAEPDVVAEARRRAARVVTAGAAEGDRHASGHGLLPDGRGWMLWEAARVEIPLPARTTCANAALAMAVAAEFGVAPADAAAGIAAMPMAPMRSEVAPLGAALLLNDAYNANPGSARAALALLRDVGHGRQRVAVLGTMRELGAQAERAHREVAEAALAMRARPGVRHRRLRGAARGRGGESARCVGADGCRCGGPVAAARTAARARRGGAAQGLARRAPRTTRTAPHHLGDGTGLMLHYLLLPLTKYESAFNIFRYISFRAAGAAVTALLLCFVAGPWILRRLRGMRVHQVVRAGTPDSHAGQGDHADDGWADHPDRGRRLHAALDAVRQPIRVARARS
jgi:UDP-N-acetylmuramoyl-tripeptide--D-alanyl-D-alanine ligase